MPRKPAEAAATTTSAARKTVTRRRKPVLLDREHVETRAYYIHLESGGDPLENWLQAERELLPVR
jgi:hypothetical protein